MSFKKKKQKQKTEKKTKGGQLNFASVRTSSETILHKLSAHRMDQQNKPH